jgi:hypothetical protein
MQNRRERDQLPTRRSVKGRLAQHSTKGLVTPKVSGGTTTEKTLRNDTIAVTTLGHSETERESLAMCSRPDDSDVNIDMETVRAVHGEDVVHTRAATPATVEMDMEIVSSTQRGCVAE